MSGKGDKPEKSGSKIKKKQSFRDDLKAITRGIKRRPSAPGQASHTVKSPKNKTKGLNRTHSLNEGSKTDKVQKEDDVEKLKIEVDEVYKSLRYIEVVVDKESLQILPATATAILDIIANVFNILSSFFANQDSSAMVSRHNQVCQCLAHFIRWADQILLYGNKMLNKDDAHDIIKALNDGMKELAQTSINKLENRKNGAPKSPGPHCSSSCQESPKRSSLPDIPLTPREREILELTSRQLTDGNHLSQSTDSIPDDSPPPKPPLPQGMESLLPRLMSKSSTDESVLESETPPPLPEKQRASGSSLGLLCSTPKTELSTPTSQSPHGSMLFLSPSHEQSVCSSGLVTPSSQSPRSCSPLSRSPASSIGSGLNQSTEDLLSSCSQRSSRTNSLSYASSESRSMSMEASVGYSQTVDEINQLTQQITQMTASIQETVPPLVPAKQSLLRFPSHYDNVTEGTPGINSSSSSSLSMLATSCSKTVTRISTSSSSSTHSSLSLTNVQGQKSNTLMFTQRTNSQETHSSSRSDISSSTSISSTESLPKPPPLPPKKRHIQTYMQTFGSYMHPTANEYAHISRRSLNFYEAVWQQHQKEFQKSFYPRSNTISVISDISSASSDNTSTSGSGSAENMGTPPALPAKQGRAANRQSQASTASSQSDLSTGGGEIREKSASMIEPPVVPPPISDVEQKRSSAPEVREKPKEKPPSPKPETQQKDSDSDSMDLKPLDDFEVSDQLIRKRPGEEGPEIRGGSVGALLVHATVAGKGDFMYQECFLTTYRTFISPKELIDKLLYRFNKFQFSPDTTKKRVARNAFSLLIRVLDELSFSELEDCISQKMTDVVFELLCQGDMTLARILRRKIVEKIQNRKFMLENSRQAPLYSHNITLSVPDFLHIKSQDIAEQMTALDAEQFLKIEIPEVLLWAKEQSEELSPNLTMFTEHFNKMSYWCRTKILTQEDPKDREKYLMKFIKIMRYLRKMSNFNSYLAILSALDSAPVRRLEWQKQNMEALKEFCQLIDSSASFRAYRQALSETEAPCIPYLGLILQDLTFVNIGNQDFLPDSSVNFAKRWQQFNILDHMRRFKKCNFDITKNGKIISFFDNFEDYKTEEELWQISERIKPRGGKKKA